MNRISKGLLLLGLLGLSLAAAAEPDARLCQQYRERLASFERDGVMTYDARTGQVRRLPDEQARLVIQQTRRRMQQACR